MVINQEFSQSVQLKVIKHIWIVCSLCLTLRKDEILGQISASRKNASNNIEIGQGKNAHDKPRQNAFNRHRNTQNR